MMALLRLTLVFVLVVILIRRKVSLGTALLAGALALGISSGMGPWPLARAVAASLADHRTLLLAAVVSLILVLSHLLEQTGQMRRLLSAYQGFSANPRLNLTLFPALIGLLPMPGGAVFSAPMVEEISRGSGLPAQHKALVNYWFRHLWEFCWPLYPGVILTVALSGIPLWVWVACQAPLALAMAGAGYLVLLRPLKPGNGSGKKGPRNLKGFFLELVPVLIVVAGAAALSPAFRAAAGALGRTAPPAEAGLLAALAAAIAWTGAANRVGAALLRKVLFNRSLASMVYMIAGIMVFSGVMDLSGTVGGVSSVFSGGGAPVFAATVALPMVVGLV
ncbi:MAG: DUF401 family protein, partial [Proteobacteria bacterium]|nr:DUF401 family protein [Pseudomonadota bacterium]